MLTEPLFKPTLKNCFKDLLFETKDLQNSCTYKFVLFKETYKMP